MSQKILKHDISTTVLRKLIIALIEHDSTALGNLSTLTILARGLTQQIRLFEFMGRYYFDWHAAFMTFCCNNRMTGIPVFHYQLTIAAMIPKLSQHIKITNKNAVT